MSAQSNTDLIRLIKDNMDGEFSELIEHIFERHDVEFGNAEALAEEIRADGSNSIFYFIREPVDYDEVAKDVAEKLDADISEVMDGDAKGYEQAALIKVMEDRLNKMKEEEREELLHNIDDLGLEDPHILDMYIKSNGVIGLAILMNTVGKVALQNILKQLLLQICGRQVAGQIIGKAGGLLIPGLNILLAAWLAIDIMGPAYRKTIPTVVELAILRLFTATN